MRITKDTKYRDLLPVFYEHYTSWLMAGMPPHKVYGPDYTLDLAIRMFAKNIDVDSGRMASLLHDDFAETHLRRGEPFGSPQSDHAIPICNPRRATWIFERVGRQVPENFYLIAESRFNKEPVNVFGSCDIDFASMYHSGTTVFSERQSLWSKLKAIFRKS